MHRLRLAGGLITTILPFISASDAPITTGNPSDVQYIATLPNTTNITGFVAISSGPQGYGVDVQVNITGLPSQGGPFRKTSSSFSWNLWKSQGADEILYSISHPPKPRQSKRNMQLDGRLLESLQCYITSRV